MLCHDLDFWTDSYKCKEVGNGFFDSSAHLKVVPPQAAKHPFLSEILLHFHEGPVLGHIAERVKK